MPDVGWAHHQRCSTHPRVCGGQGSDHLAPPLTLCVRARGVQHMAATHRFQGDCFNTATSTDMLTHHSTSVWQTTDSLPLSSVGASVSVSLLYARNPRSGLHSVTMGDRASKTRRTLPKPTAPSAGADSSTDPASRWEVEVDGGKWVPYPPPVTRDIERAFTGGESTSVQVKVDKWEYDIRFDRGAFARSSMHVCLWAPTPFTSCKSSRSWSVVATTLVVTYG